MQVSIAHDFSDVPWGRFPSDGEYCGQNFRQKFLTPALRAGEAVVVDLDGVEGFGSSFLDEAFGALVRKDHFSPEEIKAKLKITTSEKPFQMYVDLIWRYVEEAARDRELVKA